MTDTNQKKSNPFMKLAILLMIAVAIAGVFYLTPLSPKDFTPDKIKDFIQQFGILSPLIFVVIYSLRAVILVLPVGIMSLAGGLAFGQWLGWILILIGATLGSCFSFLIARYLGRGFIEERGWLNTGKIKAIDKGIEKHGLRYILFMRLIPLFQYDAVNFGAGLSKMKFRDYAFGSFIGMAPGGFINAMLGSSLDNIISVQFFVALGLFVLLMFIPALYKKLKSTRAASADKDKVKKTKGKCPVCGQATGPIALILGWDRWGEFTCPECSARVRFCGWLLTALAIMLLFTGIERLVHWLWFSPLPLWLTFTIAFVLSVMIMMIIPRIWKFKSEEDV